MDNVECCCIMSLIGKALEQSRPVELDSPEWSVLVSVVVWDDTTLGILAFAHTEQHKIEPSGKYSNDSRISRGPLASRRVQAVVIWYAISLTELNLCLPVYEEDLYNHHHEKLGWEGFRLLKNGAEALGNRQSFSDILCWGVTGDPSACMRTTTLPVLSYTSSIVAKIVREKTLK